MAPALSTDPIQMDEDCFNRLSSFVTREYGIKLPLAKKSMLESRLNKKVKSLGLASYKEFLDYIFSEEGKQGDLYHVIDLITTNKTDFFREPAHFRFLSDQFLPSYTRDSSKRNLRIWSAGCSTGEEPYTIIMMMEEYRKKHGDVNYSILASDVSIRVIQAAFQGIYDIDRIAPVPADMKQTYFLRGKSDPRMVRVKPQYRKKLQFMRINFMDSHFAVGSDTFDIIFCRNVLIYFDKATQEKVIQKFCRLLRPGGLLLLGHSESIIGLNVPLRQVSPTVYRLED